jgi:hypothetical protein
LRAPNGEIDTYRTFRWKHARVSLAWARCTVYLDLGANYLLRLRKIYPDSPVGGWGHLEVRTDLIRLLNAVPATKLYAKVPF